jgi:hypothetical protein
MSVATPGSTAHGRKKHRFLWYKKSFKSKLLVPTSVFAFPSREVKIHTETIRGNEIPKNHFFIGSKFDKRLTQSFRIIEQISPKSYLLYPYLSRSKTCSNTAMCPS